MAQQAGEAGDRGGGDGVVGGAAGGGYWQRGRPASCLCLASVSAAVSEWLVQANPKSNPKAAGGVAETSYTADRGYSY